LAGNVEANNIARWDGENWHSLGNGFGLKSKIAGINCNSDTLYVYGSFEFAGGIASKNVAKWDGKNWSGAGDGIPNPTLDVESFAGKFFASDHNLICEWDGKNWNKVTDSLDGTIRTFTIFNDTVIASVLKNMNTNLETWSVEIWEGKKWMVAEIGLSGKLDKIVRYKGVVYALENISPALNGKSNAILKWDGLKWTEIDLGNESRNASTILLKVESNILYLLTSDIHTSKNTLFKWDGINFELAEELNSSFPVLIDDFAIRQGKTYVVGAFLGIAPKQANGIAVGDKGVLNQLPSKSMIGVDDYLRLFGGRKNLYAMSEYFGLIGNFLSGGKLFTWNGTQWDTLPGMFVPNSKISGAGLHSTINSVVEDGNDLLVAGAFDSISNDSFKGIAKWDGVKWNRIGNGVPGEITKILVNQNIIYVIRNMHSNSDSIDPYNNNLLLRWDGSTWKGIADSIIEEIDDMVWYKNQLVIFGIESYGFGQGENSISFIKTWDGQAWKNLTNDRNVIHVKKFGNAVVYKDNLFVSSIRVLQVYNSSNTVNYSILNSVGDKWNYTHVASENGEGELLKLRTDGITLIAGGVFDSIGNQSVFSLASWDGSQWKSLGSGLKNVYGHDWPFVSGLEIFQNFLYMSTRHFDPYWTVGGKAYFNLARWSLDGNISINPFSLKNPATKSPTYFLSSHSVQSKDFMNSSAKKVNAFDLQGRSLWEWNLNQGEPNQNLLGPRLPTSKQVQVIKVN